MNKQQATTHVSIHKFLKAVDLLTWGSYDTESVVNKQAGIAVKRTEITVTECRLDFVRNFIDFYIHLFFKILNLFFFLKIFSNCGSSQRSCIIPGHNRLSTKTPISTFFRFNSFRADENSFSRHGKLKTRHRSEA